MTSGREPGADRLLCGARVDELLDQVAADRAAEPDDHQAGCPHCLAALGEYARLWAPVRETAATQVRAPESFLENALARIRGAVADPGYAVLTGPTGVTRIAARVVVVTARETAQDIAGVRVALSKLVSAGVTAEDGASGTRLAVPVPDRAPEPDPARDDGPRDDGPRVSAGVAGRSTAIEVTLAADYGVDLHELGARIRAEIIDRVRRLTGLEPVSVTVHIDDIFT